MSFLQPRITKICDQKLLRGRFCLREASFINYDLCGLKRNIFDHTSPIRKPTKFRNGKTAAFISDKNEAMNELCEDN